MAPVIHVEQSRTYPVAVEETFERLLPIPLPTLFATWFGPLPPIKAVEQDGTWGTVGQVRTIRLGDGGSMRERLTSVEHPHRFDYEITGFAGALKPLVEKVDGAWVVDAVGTGSKVTWSWDLHPRGRVGAVLVPGIARLWPGYARGALARLETLLLG